MSTTVSNPATMLSQLVSTSSSGSSSSSSSSASAAQAAGTSSSQQLAGNFDTFLQLLTTQLQNQNPLDPLDTNQFTEQLVEFASVEQQINMNTNLQSLISMQQTSEATSALQLVRSTVTVGGDFRDALERNEHRRHLEPHHHHAGDRHRDRHQLDRRDRLQRHVVAECRNTELHLERPRQ